MDYGGVEMDKNRNVMARHCALAAAVALALGVAPGLATEPCGDFGECKVLVEINSSDGDIGFHFLSDGDELTLTKLMNPEGKKIFRASAKREFKEQTFTELFAESAEPLCFDPLGDDDPENDDEDFRTLEEFIELWIPGEYTLRGRDLDFELLVGSTELGFDLPAAPANLAYSGGMITWEPGDDLGECADTDRLQGLVDEGLLPEHPMDVAVSAWEVVLEPDLEDGDPAGDEIFSIRISGSAGSLAVSVPTEYLDALPEDTPAKLEIGAIGAGDNATFTEIDGICLNEVGGCEED
jgi:hypothetical protein